MSFSLQAAGSVHRKLPANLNQPFFDRLAYSAATNSGELFFKLSMPFIYSDDFYNRNWQWLKERQAIFDQILTKEYFEALVRLSRSSKDFDILDQIHRIKTPTLLIAGTRDIIPPVYQFRKSTPSVL